MVKRAERAKQQNDVDQSILSHRWLRHRRADLVAFTPRGTDQITPLVTKHSLSRGVGKRVGAEEEEPSMASPSTCGPSRIHPKGDLPDHTARYKAITQ